MNKAIRFEIEESSTAAKHANIQAVEDAPSGLLYAYVPSEKARDFVNETDADPRTLIDHIESLLTDADVISDNDGEPTAHLDMMRETFGAFEIWGIDTTLDVHLI